VWWYQRHIFKAEGKIKYNGDEGIILHPLRAANLYIGEVENGPPECTRSILVRNRQVCYL